MSQDSLEADPAGSCRNSTYHAPATKIRRNEIASVAPSLLASDAPAERGLSALACPVRAGRVDESATCPVGPAQQFVTVNAAVYNLFNPGSHVISVKNYRQSQLRSFASWNYTTM